MSYKKSEASPALGFGKLQLLKGNLSTSYFIVRVRANHRLTLGVTFKTRFGRPRGKISISISLNVTLPFGDRTLHTQQLPFRVHWWRLQ
jgi:hypothetical protein